MNNWICANRRPTYSCLSSLPHPQRQRLASWNSFPLTSLFLLFSNFSFCSFLMLSKYVDQWLTTPPMPMLQLAIYSVKINWMTLMSLNCSTEKSKPCPGWLHMSRWPHYHYTFHPLPSRKARSDARRFADVRRIAGNDLSADELSPICTADLVTGGQKEQFKPDIR